jgi:uncharacterized membrane protein YphA (DoxX/SURF4 family)
MAMRSIDIDETPPRWNATLGHTLLRGVFGCIVIGHCVDRFLHLRTFRDGLVAFDIPEPEIVAVCLLGVELLAGLGLVLGRWTRFSAFIALCEAFAVVSVIVQQNRLLTTPATLETAVLGASVAIYFIAVGSGGCSADALLRRRARLKAIRDDEIWQRPPYVAPEESGVYDDAGELYDSTQGVVLDTRARGLRFHSSRG